MTSDDLVRAYAQTYGFEVTATNCTNNYGPYQFPEKLIPSVIVNILEGRQLPISGDGQNVRDWLFMEDHCRAIDRVLSAAGSGDTYNVGGQAELTNLGLVGMLCDLADDLFAGDTELGNRFPGCPAAAGQSARSLIEFVPDRPALDRRYAIDGRKFARELGFASRVTPTDGLLTNFGWYLDHEPWWRAMMDGSYRNWVTRQYGHRMAT